jgi:hypothetical protein
MGFGLGERSILSVGCGVGFGDDSIDRLLLFFRRYCLGVDSGSGVMLIEGLGLVTVEGMFFCSLLLITDCHLIRLKPSINPPKDTANIASQDSNPKPFLRGFCW